MERFFLSRKSQVFSGIIVGFLLGFALRPSVVQMVGLKLFAALTSGAGLFWVLAVVALAVFVAITIYTWLTKRGGGHPNQ